MLTRIGTLNLLRVLLPALFLLIGVVPAMRGDDFGSQLALRPLLGVPLALWGVNNLLRRIPAKSIVVGAPPLI